MAAFPLTPIIGINTVAEDAALRQSTDQGPRTYVRDAVNLDITPAGRLDVRPGARQVPATPYGNLWQSPSHKDVSGTLDGQWSRRTRRHGHTPR